MHLLRSFRFLFLCKIKIIITIIIIIECFVRIIVQVDSFLRDFCVFLYYYDCRRIASFFRYVFASFKCLLLSLVFFPYFFFIQVVDFLLLGNFFIWLIYVKWLCMSAPSLLLVLAQKCVRTTSSNAYSYIPPVIKPNEASTQSFSDIQKKTTNRKYIACCYQT